jgi:hypothetical protein
MLVYLYSFRCSHFFSCPTFMRGCEKKEKNPSHSFQVGLKIPLLAMKHAYVTTEMIPGIENMPNIRQGITFCTIYC